MHYPDSRWRPRCQGKSRDDVSGRILHCADSHIAGLGYYLTSIAVVTC